MPRKKLQPDGSVVKRKDKPSVLLLSPAYRAWAGMLTRCRNKNHKDYPYYGGRGIKVCERWLVYANFLADMGEKPSRENTIEREKNDGDYEPGNCRWATKVEQGANKRNNLMFDYKGEKMCLSELARRTGIGFGTLKHRLLVMKLPVEEATTAPINSLKKRK